MPRSFAAGLGIALFACAVAAGQERGTEFWELSQDETLTVTAPDGTAVRTRTKIALRHSWRRKSTEAVLGLVSLAERRFVNDRPVADTFTSLQGIRSDIGQGQSLEFRNAAPSVQQVLSDTFGGPLLKLELDAQGAPKKQVPLAGPGAEEIVRKGYIAPLLLMQAPLPGKEPRWQAPGELGFGQLAMAAGTLKYEVPKAKSAEAAPAAAKESAGNDAPPAPPVAKDAPVEKAPKKDDAIRVTVSGVLANKDGKIDPLAGLRLYDAACEVSGEQVYSPAKKRWTSARLTVKTTYKLTRDDRAAGLARGQTVLELKALD